MMRNSYLLHQMLRVRRLCYRKLILLTLCAIIIAFLLDTFIHLSTSGDSSSHFHTIESPPTKVTTLKSLSSEF